MLVLPDTSLKEGEVIVARLLQAIRHARAIHSMPSFSYICSAGLVELHPA